MSGGRWNNPSAQRSSDPRYCAPCGILWHDVQVARAHRAELHPNLPPIAADQAWRGPKCTECDAPFKSLGDMLEHHQGPCGQKAGLT